MNDFERKLKKQEIAFAAISTLLLLLIFGLLAVNEGMREQEDIRTHEKAIEADLESYAVQEEEMSRAISRYESKNNDLELTNNILVEQIKLLKSKGDN